MGETTNVAAGQGAGKGTVNLSSPRAIFAGSPPRFTRSRVTYEAYAVSRTSTRPRDGAFGADQAAEALRPLAGDLTYTLFAVGIMGIGFMAVPILSGSASYAWLRRWAGKPPSATRFGKRRPSTPSSLWQPSSG